MAAGSNVPPLHLAENHRLRSQPPGQRTHSGSSVTVGSRDRFSTQTSAAVRPQHPGEAQPVAGSGRASTFADIRSGGAKEADLVARPGHAGFGDHGLSFEDVRLEPRYSIVVVLRSVPKSFLEQRRTLLCESPAVCARFVSDRLPRLSQFMMRPCAG